jgi:lambda family phage tail tape measure protein
MGGPVGVGIGAATVAAPYVYDYAKNATFGRSRTIYDMAPGGQPRDLATLLADQGITPAEDSPPDLTALMPSLKASYLALETASKGLKTRTNVLLAYDEQIKKLKKAADFDSQRALANDDGEAAKKIASNLKEAMAAAGKEKNDALNSLGKDNSQRLSTLMDSGIKQAKDKAKDALDEIDSLFKRGELTGSAALARKYNANAVAMGSEYGAIQQRLAAGVPDKNEKNKLEEREKQLFQEMIYLGNQYNRDVLEEGTKRAMDYSAAVNALLEPESQHAVQMETAAANYGKTALEIDKAYIASLQRAQALILESEAENGATEASKEHLKFLDKMINAKGRQVAVQEEQRTFESGWSNAYTRYQDDATNAARLGEKVFTSAVDAMTEVSSKWATGQKVNFGQVAQSFAAMVLKMQLEESAAKLVSSGKRFFDGALSSAGSFVSSLFKFESGGIMTDRGPLPLRKYSSGGVANSPQLAMFGEGSVPEAYVPVPSGKIPVELRGAGGSSSPVINVNIQNAPSQPEVRTSRSAGGEFNLEVIFGNFENRLASNMASGRGPVSSTLRSNFGIGPIPGM